MSITITFQPWRRFRARKDAGALHRWLDQIGHESVLAFRQGMGVGPPRSAPGAWPNTDTGRLYRSIDHETTRDTVTVGTNTHYSMYLRTGTSRMARRKMSDNALHEGYGRARGRLGHWVHWVQG